MSRRNVIRASDPQPHQRGSVASRMIRAAGGGQHVHSRHDRPRVYVKQHMVIVWSLILTLATVMIIGGFMMFWLRSHGRKARAMANPEREFRIVSRFDPPSDEQALALVKRALATRSADEVDAFFRTSGSTSDEVVGFLADLEQRDGRIKRYLWLSSIDADGLQLEGVLAFYGDQPPYKERLVFLTPDERGVWKVDYESFARKCQPPWKELIDGKTNGAEVRVFIGRDSYYNGHFASDEEWESYAIISLETKEVLPDGQQIIYGYCRKSTPQARALAKMFVDDVRTRRATLRLYHPEGAGSRQFEISRVMSEDWVLAAQDYDSKFN